MAVSRARVVWAEVCREHALGAVEDEDDVEAAGLRSDHSTPYCGRARERLIAVLR